eukprot:scaffold10175_cov17-Tisochrysis_lutea.AAC.1
MLHPIVNNRSSILSYTCQADMMSRHGGDGLARVMHALAYIGQGAQSGPFNQCSGQPAPSIIEALKAYLNF